MTDLNLTSWVKISTSGIWKDDERLLTFNNETPSDKLKQAYKELGLSYPKFFKMDGLCKLGLLGSELLLSDSVKQNYQDDEIAVLLSNRNSSLQSDLDHCEAYTENTASPAIFVYTLPNIVVGEICIRHKLLGESNFYIFESFRADQLLEQANLLVTASPTKACLIGWVEYLNDTFEAEFFFLDNKGNSAANPHILDIIKNTTY